MILYLIARKGKGLNNEKVSREPRDQFCSPPVITVKVSEISLEDRGPGTLVAHGGRDLLGLFPAASWALTVVWAWQPQGLSSGKRLSHPGLGIAGDPCWLLKLKKKSQRVNEHPFPFLVLSRDMCGHASNSGTWEVTGGEYVSWCFCLLEPAGAVQRWCPQVLCVPTWG